MLSLGLTGGIAAGKSLLSTRFRELGAVVIDADQLAREVVAPGTPGLAQVVAQFGQNFLLPDGSLDRLKLGSLVFADPSQRQALNAIIHPRVRAAAQSMKDQAGPGAIVVQDIPLLVETGQGAAFHLVVVVQASAETRVARMMATRGMSREDAQARMDAQASDAERAAAADVVIANDGDPQQAIAALDALWHGRLLPFAANLADGQPAAGPLTPQNVPADPRWPVQAARLAARVKTAVGELAVSVDHIGATSVPGQPAPDVLELQVQVRTAEDLLAAMAPLAAAGFPLSGRTSGGGSLHVSADPGRAATVTALAQAPAQHSTG
ncbi:dephospho-CoA kinase [Arthrobacter glacialis]|uniref:Dephospho-CoA kinase n=1 Tax=Arthrobacter glacialis TaxID=1664 RepID=A0A2S3ZSY7_ARTGL|nr:dephospho-CoA kinase [Arthrobacter glacialis]POH72365.1 dephospho-CoA kinase [Arthrobacter glacialis]